MIRAGMGAVRAIARGSRDGWLRLRFRAWTLRLRFELARRGARLVVHAPHGMLLDRWPVVRVRMEGSGDARVVLEIGRDVSLGRGVTLDIWAGAHNVLQIGERVNIA